MNIRSARPQDASRISYLIKTNTDKVLENNYSPEQITTWKKANTPKAIRQYLQQRVVFCAFENERLVGTISLAKNEVVGLYINFTKRRKGLGKQLLDHLEAYARSQNIDELTLTSTPSAKSFYLKNGYQVVGNETIYVAGVAFPETRMNKKL